MLKSPVPVKPQQQPKEEEKPSWAKPRAFDVEAFESLNFILFDFEIF